MVNKSKILSDLSKMAVDAMGTFSSIKKDVETLVSLRVNKIINRMNLVKRDEFEVLKKLVQKDDVYRIYKYDKISSLRVIRYDVEGLLK